MNDRNAARTGLSRWRSWRYEQNLALCWEHDAPLFDVARANSHTLPE